MSSSTLSSRPQRDGFIVSRSGEILAFDYSAEQAEAIDEDRNSTYSPDQCAGPQKLSSRRTVRLAYLVSHPIQYQAPLLRRIAQEPDIDLTVFFGSDLSVRAYRDDGFGVDIAWDTPLLEGYRSVFLPALRDTRTISSLSPISRGILRHLQDAYGSPAFDALWVHGYASINALHGIFAANALGIPVLLRAESWLGDRPRSRHKLLLKLAFLHLLKHAVSAVLPIGTHNAEYWRHYFGEDVPQFPMPYAVDNQVFAARTAQARPHVTRLRAELGMHAHSRVILFASKLQSRKQADHLVRAYADLVRGTPEEKRPYLVIVGDGEERGRIEKMCAERNLRRVRLVGFRNQTELPGFFALADVFVLPSRDEPWGLIVNEAMASGCPVIVSSGVGCHPDLVTDGVEGFVYPEGDLGALTSRLREVLVAPVRAHGMGVASRQRIQDNSFEADVHGLRQALAFCTRRLRA